MNKFPAGVAEDLWLTYGSTSRELRELCKAVGVLNGARWVVEVDLTSTDTVDEGVRA